MNTKTWKWKPNGKVKSGSAVYVNSKQKTLGITKFMMQNCQRQFKRDIALLLDQLETVMNHAQTARVIRTGWIVWPFRKV